jgi:hypothetical protein
MNHTVLIVQDGATLLHVVAACKKECDWNIDGYVNTARELLQHGFSLVAKDKVGLNATKVAAA